MRPVFKRKARNSVALDGLLWQFAAFSSLGPPLMDDKTHTAAFDKGANTGLKHLVNATKFSLNGLVEAFRRESAFRQELALIVILVAPAWWLARTLFDFVILMSVCALVLVVELLNSAVEAAIDRMGTDHHEMSGLAKDYGSAAVMVSLVIAGAVWLAFLVDRL